MGDVRKDIVLIVDDAPKNIDMLIDMIEPYNYEIAVATSGEAALEIIDSVSPDIVLLDVEMPGMDGYQTCRQIKRGEVFKDVPVIFVTAKTDICDLKTGFDVGCVDYIRKPIQQEEVLARIRTHLRLRKLTKGLQQHNRQLSAILSTVMEGTFCVDADGKIDCINPAALKQLGYTNEELLGQSLGLLIPDFGKTPKEWENSSVCTVCLKGNGEYYSENHVFRRNDGDTFPAEFTAAPLNDSEGGSFGAIIAFRDITDRKESHQQLVSLMSTDQLTGLVNWSEFSRQLSKAISLSRESVTEIMLFLLDIDDFRDVNDTLGHDVGDLLLTMIADRLREHYPQDVMITRLGGDEFALFRSCDPAVLDIDQEARNILDIVSNTYVVLRHNIYVSASLGVVLKGDMQFSADDMIRAADVAVFRAKEAGKNSFKVFTNEMQKEVVRRTSRVNSIRQALEEKAFVAYFQPLVDASSGDIVGAEGLARWIRDGKIVPPAEFIHEAEDSGLIDELSSTVFGSAFAAASRWNRGGKNAYIAVNVCAKQLRNNNFSEDVFRLMDIHHLAKDKLVLEITETALMHDIDSVMIMFEKFREHGVRIAIDDFGTGFSSLSYLTRIHADILKIDRSFVQGIGKDNAHETIVRTIITMAHNLGMIVIAEGVETQAQVDYLRQYGCDTFQGYYFGRPVADDTFFYLLSGAA